MTIGMSPRPCGSCLIRLLTVPVHQLVEGDLLLLDRGMLEHPLHDVALDREAFELGEATRKGQRLRA